MKMHGPGNIKYVLCTYWFHNAMMENRTVEHKKKYVTELWLPLPPRAFAKYKEFQV
jgi:hypothetical protein